MKVAVFNVATGQILRNVECPVGMAGLQTLTGEDWIEGDYPLGQFYVDDFEAVAIPARPSAYHQFNYTTKAWEDPRTLAEMKADKIAAIDAAWRLNAPAEFTFDAKQIAMDPTSRAYIEAANRIITTAGALPTGWPDEWLATDGTTVTVDTVLLWEDFYAAMVSEEEAGLLNALNLKAQVAAATTPAEVAAVPDW